MPTNLTNTVIKDTYGQLLHIDGGPATTEKVVYSANGVATALRLGTTSASLDNIQFNGNSIIATNLNGDITLVPNGTGEVNIPRVNFTEVEVARTSLGLGTLAIQNANNVNITGGAITGVTFTGSFSGVTSITSDSYSTSTATAGLTLTGNDLLADGTDTNIDIDLIPKGSGAVKSTSILATDRLGFTVGNGGAVTQTTSRTTGVTLNAPSGQITLVSASISGLSSQEFTLTNSFIGATDVVVVSFASGLTAATYDVTVTATAAGSCDISVHNVNNSATPTDTPVINFVVIKGVVS